MIKFLRYEETTFGSLVRHPSIFSGAWCILLKEDKVVSLGAGFSFECLPVPAEIVMKDLKWEVITSAEEEEGVSVLIILKEVVKEVLGYE